MHKKGAGICFALVLAVFDGLFFIAWRHGGGALACVPDTDHAYLSLLLAFIGPVNTEY